MFCNLTEFLDIVCTKNSQRLSVVDAVRDVGEFPHCSIVSLWCFYREAKALFSCQAEHSHELSFPQGALFSNGNHTLCSKLCFVYCCQGYSLSYEPVLYFCKETQKAM